MAAHICDLDDAKAIVRAGVDIIAHGVRDKPVDAEFIEMMKARSAWLAADVDIGSHAIKAGTSIVMPIYAIHRHRERWCAPNLFDPIRFAPENEAKIARYQYLPFGAGPRICIGMAFAMIEATAMLATILQAARFETVADHVPIPIARVTLHPKGGMPLKVWVE